MATEQQTEFQELDPSQSTQQSQNEIGIFPYVPLDGAIQIKREAAPGPEL